MFMLPWKERRQALAILRPVRACSAPEHCCSPRCNASTACGQSTVRGVSQPDTISCSPTPLAPMGADLRCGAWGEPVVPRSQPQPVLQLRVWVSARDKAQMVCAGLRNGVRASLPAWPCWVPLASLDWTNQKHAQRDHRKGFGNAVAPLNSLLDMAIWILLIRAKSGITHTMLPDAVVTSSTAIFLYMKTERQFVLPLGYQ